MYALLKEMNLEYSLEGLMLKLKFQYFGYLMWRADSLEKTLMLGKIEGRRRRGQEDEMVGWHYQLNGHEFEQTLGDSEGQGSLACCSPWVHKELDTTEQLNNNKNNIHEAVKFSFTSSQNFFWIRAPQLCLKTAWVGFSEIWDRNSNVPTCHTLFTCPVKSSSDQ